MSLTEFLRDRFDEDERHARKLAESDRRPALSLATTVNHPERLLLEVEAKRRIIALHESWPVLVEQPPTFDMAPSGPNDMAFRVSQKMAWMTNQEYRARFGAEPPTTPMLRALAAIYADHDDYDEGWRP